jgi:hypothetical protein
VLFPVLLGRDVQRSTFVSQNKRAHILKHKGLRKFKRMKKVKSVLAEYRKITQEMNG